MWEETIFNIYWTRAIDIDSIGYISSYWWIYNIFPILCWVESFHFIHHHLALNFDGFSINDLWTHRSWWMSVVDIRFFKGWLENRESWIEKKNTWREPVFLLFHIPWNLSILFGNHLCCDGLPKLCSTNSFWGDDWFKIMMIIMD